MTAGRELDAAIAAVRGRDPKLEVPASEARILWGEVGPDRLTLSMFGQLDSVPFERIRPIARVRPPAAGDWIIGADERGFLVCAASSSGWEGVPTSDRDEQRLIHDLILLRERVADMEEALARRAAYDEHRAALRELPLVLLVPDAQRRKETL